MKPLLPGRLPAGKIAYWPFEPGWSLVGVGFFGTANTVAASGVERPDVRHWQMVGQAAVHLVGH